MRSLVVSRLLVVDDHPVVRAGVAHLLARASGIRLVGEATCAEQAVARVRTGDVDLVLLDLRLGESLAPDVCADLFAANGTVKVVVFTAFHDHALLHACLAAGASGLLLKDAMDFDLVGALHRVLAGHLVIDPRLEPALPQPVAPSGHEELTHREYEVLRLMAQGLTSRETATRLYLTVNTVRSYSQVILTKLGAHNRVQALAIARERRLL